MKPLVLKKLNNRNGAALVFVIMIFAVVCIFFTIVTNLFQANLKQAKAQENELGAYYLSQSGSDLCFAALLQEGTGGENDTLLYKKFSTAMVPNIHSTPTLEDELTLQGGTVKLTVKAIEISGERWVEIKSDATLDVSQAKKTTTLQFQVSNPLVQKRS